MTTTSLTNTKINSQFILNTESEMTYAQDIDVFPHQVGLMLSVVEETVARINHEFGINLNPNASLQEIMDSAKTSIRELYAISNENNPVPADHPDQNFATNFVNQKVYSVLTALVQASDFDTGASPVLPDLDKVSFELYGFGTETISAGNNGNTGIAGPMLFLENGDDFILSGEIYDDFPDFPNPNDGSDTINLGNPDDWQTGAGDLNSPPVIGEADTIDINDIIDGKDIDYSTICIQPDPDIIYLDENPSIIQPGSGEVNLRDFFASVDESVIKDIPVGDVPATHHGGAIHNDLI